MNATEFKLWKFIGLCSGIGYLLTIIFNRIVAIFQPQLIGVDALGSPLTFLFFGLILTGLVALFETIGDSS